jgi:phosphate-selective porin OprO/OprP
MKRHAAALAAPLLLLALSDGVGQGLSHVAGDRLRLEALLQADRYDYRGAPFATARREDTGIRRAELVLNGVGPGRLGWELGYDLRARRWLDAAAALDFTKGHSLQLGQYKQPFGMEELTSSRSTDFISRTAATGALAIGRRAGVGYRFGSEVWSLSAGAFDRNLAAGGAQGRGHALRATWAPIRTPRRTLHLALAYAGHEVPDATLRLSARPYADLSDQRLLDTGRFPDAERYAVRGVEFLWLSGALKLQAEYLDGRIERRTAPDHRARGAYLSAVYGLGGANWSYRDALPRAAAPDEPCGQWQLAARLDALDLDDAGVAGGRMDAFTLGVNWACGPHLRLSLNATRIDAERRAVPADAEVLGLRAQLHW